MRRGDGERFALSSAPLIADDARQLALDEEKIALEATQLVDKLAVLKIGAYRVCIGARRVLTKCARRASRLQPTCRHFRGKEPTAC